MPDVPANTNNRWFDGRGRRPRGGTAAVGVRHAPPVADPARRWSLRDGSVLGLLAVVVIDVGLLANDAAAVAIDARGTALSVARPACLAVAVGVVFVVPGRATIPLATVEACPGHGMGLARAARIIARHGQRLRARGTPGEGCQLSFRLR